MFFFMLLYLVLVLIRPQDYPAMAEALPVPVLQVTLGLALVAWLASRAKSFAAPQYLLIGLFLVVLMVSKVVNGWAGGALVQLLKFGPIVAAFVILANAVTTPARIRTVMVVFVLCSTVLAIHGIDQVQTGIGWTGEPLSQGTRIQYVGIFNDPNDLGLLFVMCLPMALYLSSRGGLLGLRRLFWWAAGGTLLYGIYLTNSRGALLALVTLVGAYVWQRRGLVSAAVFGGVGLVGLMLIPSRLSELDIDESSAMGRVDSWYEGIQMFIADPLFGIGADGFSDLHYLTAHNSFVLVLAETGIIGYTIWLAFVGYCFRMPLAVLRMQRQPADAAAASAWAAERKLALTLLLSLFGFFAAAFFLSRSYIILLYLLAAVVVGYYAGARQRYPDLPTFDLGKDLVLWPLVSVASIVFLYVLVKVMLGLA
ncbi:O-antigen ligase family protein [Dokdonella koreensis]|uniref:O-antigen polymerase family protein n=1 Tax=Dokdonella koreensis DS-123 TaxID=1300342 RepID=A0A167GQV7_9GAMM|nr:O-antigen ligase family protein [Dokdonella koreensis]ANB17166.1 O-antigen polymerase family protein [Dokdonella koreensis DS-123]